MDALDFDVVEIERFLTSWLNNLGGDNWRRGEFRRREGRGSAAGLRAFLEIIKPLEASSNSGIKLLQKNLGSLTV